MKVLVIRHEDTGNVSWTTYQLDDPAWKDDLQASMNTMGVVKVEVFPG